MVADISTAIHALREEYGKIRKGYARFLLRQPVRHIHS
jgi:hypothetical protein